MAYNADNEESVELVNIQKGNKGDYIIARKIRNKVSKAESVDIRLSYTDDQGIVKPTQKGVRVNTESLLELLKGVVKALDIVEAEELRDYLDEIINGKDDAIDEEDDAADEDKAEEDDAAKEDDVDDEDEE